MKPKLLFLAPQNPYPPIDGGKIGIYYPVKYLSKFFDIYFITPVKQLDKNVDRAIRHFQNIEVKYLPVVKNTDDKIIDLFKNVFNEVPFKWYKYYSDDIFDLCEKLVIKEDIRYILISAPHMALYAVKLKKLNPSLKIYLREHNIEFSLVEQFINFTKNPVYKLIGVWQFKKTKLLEQKYWELFDKIFFISDYDYEIAKSFRPDLVSKFYVLYDGFEINKICKCEEFRNAFIIPTNINAIQNQVSVKWFIEKIWIPSFDYIKQNNFVLSITSGSEHEWKKILGIHNLEQFNIRLLGFIKNIDEELCKHKYVISPTIMGSGLRLKILHSMASGKVVFATGYDVKTVKVFKDMDNIVEFNNSVEFIEKIKIIEANKSLFNILSKNAVETIQKYFDWNQYAKFIFENFTGEKP
jgi:glycosyltransferase involved in cell wall biosynthesis